MYRYAQQALIYFVFTIFTVVSVNMGVPSIAQADWVNDSKSAGLVGEKQNGYLGFVNAPNANTKKQVETINLQRRAKYREIAKKRGAGLAAVEKLAGKAIIKNLPAGQYHQNPKGKWVKKK